MLPAQQNLVPRIQDNFKGMSGRSNLPNVFEINQESPVAPIEAKWLQLLFNAVQIPPDQVIVLNCLNKDPFGLAAFYVKNIPRLQKNLAALDL